MTRSIKEAENSARIRRHLIRTDVLRNTASFASDNFRTTDRIKKRCFTVVNVAHDRDDRWTALKVFFFIKDFHDDIFDVRVRNTHNLVAKLFDDQLGCIRIDRFVLCDHHAVVHQRLHDCACLFSHTCGQLRDDNRRRQLNVADDLFTLNRATHRLLTRALLLTLHGCHGFMTTTAATKRLVQCQLARTTSVIGTRLLACIALIAFTVCFTWRSGWRWLVRSWARCRRWLVRGRCRSNTCCIFRCFLRFGFRFGFCLGTFSALKLFFFFRFNLGTAAVAIFCARFFFCLTACRVFDFACFRSLDRF